MAGITDCCGLAQYVDGVTILCNPASGKLYSPEPATTCVTTDYVRGTGAGVASVDIVGPTGVGSPIGPVIAISSETITNPYPCTKRLKLSEANGNLDLHVTNSPSGTYTPHSLTFGLEVSLDGGATFRLLSEVRSVYNPAITPFSHRAVDAYKRQHQVNIGAGASITPIWRCSYSNLGGANDANRVLMSLFDFEWEIF